LSEIPAANLCPRHDEPRGGHSTWARVATEARNGVRPNAARIWLEAAPLDASAEMIGRRGCGGCSGGDAE
jgi:hypothetical protein